MDLQVIPEEKVERKDISLREIKKSKKVEERKYDIEKKEVSKNIQKFDKKPRVYTENPYSFNYVSLKRERKITPTAEAMVANPLYNAVGKTLGLDTTKEWNQYYDKVFEITEWAKKKANTEDTLKIVRFLSNKTRTLPSLGARRIDDIYIHIGITK